MSRRRKQRGKAKTDKKPRTQHVYIGCSEQFNRVERTSDSFIVPDDGREYWIFHQREYARSKKPKILYALFRFFGSSELRMRPFAELQRYDRVFAVDTNYRQVGAKRLAATTVAEGVWLADRSGMKTHLRETWTFEPGSAAPEREGWHRFFEWVAIEQAERGCLFVDSDLGRLHAINARREPVIAEVLLPENWQLNFAGSDKTDNFPAVQLMRACDKGSEQALPDPSGHSEA